MLNSDTKRHIDAARDVLVGVAPNPTTQIDQITYALIYKFMDDMDQASVKAGGEASFFVGDLEKYAWSNLMSTRMGNQEKMDLYSEALTKFSEAKQLPELFRTIFRAAFLPYRSPETLGLFLKEISYFDYTHPEELGNAYEYLLSIMSSQGDAGQFRTPRHIIDFIVDVINPTKDDKVLDPACGTGGFLVSTYNHILEQHDGKDDPKKKEKPLTPDERKKLMSNLQGYDIDPTMVRIAQVNMYLHQFKNPQIFQYDSLTSEERWNDKYDVILANPPFMSPKGGIKPHNKFGVASNRAEVLFVDYIINHLKPKGRAGIVVPEGIIFQSGKAYKELRKNLVENGLFAVVSLPGGVFQPYSGVKTSILFFDNETAKLKSEVAFVKISADGYDLGASKRMISENDLPVALELLRSWTGGKQVGSPICTLVSKEKLATNGDYNLSGDRYKVGIDYSNAKWPMVKLENVTLNISNGYTYKNEKSSGGLPISRIQTISHGNINFDLVGYADIDTVNPKYLMQVGDILFSHINSIDHLGKVAIYTKEMKPLIHGMNLLRIVANQDLILPAYLFHILRSSVFRTMVKSFAKQAVNQASINIADLNALEIPLPPIEIQEQIVAELDGYAAIVSGSRQIIENWKPKIDVSREWELEPLGNFAHCLNGFAFKSELYVNAGIRVIRITNVQNGYIKDDEPKYYPKKLETEISRYELFENDLLVSLTGNVGRVGLLPKSFLPAALNQRVACLRITDESRILKKYLFYFLNQKSFELEAIGASSGVAQKNLSTEWLKNFKIPVPPIEVQFQLIEQIDAEASQVDFAKQLIEIYESKIQKVLSSLWDI